MTIWGYDDDDAGRAAVPRLRHRDADERGSRGGTRVEWGIVRAQPQMEAPNEGPSRTGP